MEKISTQILLNICLQKTYRFLHPARRRHTDRCYPPLSSSNIPTALLNDANANILVSPADRGWKTIDKQLCEQLITQMGQTDVPFRVCLTNANRDATEDFTGQLPPYTLLRRISYRFSQLSLTERNKFNLRGKAKETEEEEDDE